ncbi:hypothetical protein Tco_1049429 [Tanacetum coccineum]
MILIINGLKKDRMLKRLVKREAGAAISNSVHHSQVIISGKQVCKINEVLGRIYIFGSISQRYIDSAMRGCAPLENMLNHHSSTSPQSIELSALMRPFIWSSPYGKVPIFIVVVALMCRFGYKGVGLVAAVGGVKHLKVGTWAAVMTFGSYAEFYLIIYLYSFIILSVANFKNGSFEFEGFSPKPHTEKFENCAKPARFFGLTWNMPSYYFALPTEKKTDRRRPTPSLCLGCRYTLGTSFLNSWNSDVAFRPFGSLKMSDVERVDMGSQAEASSSSKRDMGSYISTMRPSEVKALTRKYKIPRDLHPVAVSSEWTMDRLTDEYIGLYEQHHDSDISDPAPKVGFDEDDVITLTNQPIDIRSIPSGLLFSAGLATTWEFPKFRPLFKDPEGNVVTMSEYLRLPFLSGMTIEAGGDLTEQDVIPQHTTTPFSDDDQVPGKMDSQQRVEASDPKIVATRIRKAQAAAKRKAEKNWGSEDASGPEGGSKRHKEKSTDPIPCPTPLRTIEAVTSDVPRGENVVSPTQTQGDNLLEIPAHDSANTTTRPCEEHHDEHSGVLGNRDGNFDDDVDEEVNLEEPDRHVSDTIERVAIRTESIPAAATHPDNGKSIAQEETPMPDPLPRGAGADEAGSSLPPPLFVPTWGIHQRSRVTTLEECRDLMANLVPPGVQEEMHLLDNNVVLDRAWFTLARGAMPQAHALRQFQSLYDTHHALQEKHLQHLSERHRKLREDHGHCSKDLAVVLAEKDSLMATNAEQALRIKELEQQLKSADEVHSSAVKDLEGQLARKDSALVYAERVSSDRLSENEELRTQLAFAKREKTDAIRKLLPTVVGRLLQSHEYKQSLSVPFNYALQTGWGQGLAEARSEEELSEIMMRMNGFDPYSDKKMNAEYERLFSKTYSYVDRIYHLSEKPVQDLLKLHPAPPPKDAPKAGSGGIAFAPKLVRAAEVAGSKDTVSLQDPVSDHASEGSKAPPFKKT